MVSTLAAARSRAARSPLVSAAVTTDRNVSPLERWASVLAGGALGLYGLTRGTCREPVLALLGGGLLHRGLTGHSYVYGALGVNTDRRRPATAVPAGHGVKVDITVTINRPAAELYAVLAAVGEPSALHVTLAHGRNARRQTIALGSRGATETMVEWDAEIIKEENGRLLAWRSVPGSTVDMAGSVHFKPAPAARGTEVAVVLKYDPPAGKIAWPSPGSLVKTPSKRSGRTCAASSKIMEAGEVATTSGQPRCA